jgi:EAL domain-containing protein (putative c-di-GMP-specific phosphodiesterase class I)
MEAALQPIVDLATGRVVGAEALARFPDRRAPDVHFAEADSKGILIDLEIAAVRAALRRLAELPPSAYLTVNVSPATAVSPRLAAALAGTPAHRIVLELTEHAPVADYPTLEAALSSLRARGVRVAVDDAGAGFASMRHVLSLRPDVIKLDVSITRGVDEDLRRRELVRAMVSFSRATGCTLVAEGIETEDELAALRALGVRCGQGFHLGRPEKNAAGPWEIALPPLRWRPGRANAASRSAVRRRPRFRRVVRPASVALAAAIAWPGIASVAGLKAPSPGTVRVPVAGSRTDSGGSPQVRSMAPRPATTSTSARPPARTAAASNVTRSAAPARPAARSSPVTTTARTVDATVSAALGATASTVDATVDTVGRLLTRLLGR